MLWLYLQQNVNDVSFVKFLRALKIGFVVMIQSAIYVFIKIVDIISVQFVYGSQL